MHTITINRAMFKLADTRDFDAFRATVAKITGKTRRTPLVGRTSRKYPAFAPGMSTAEYVRDYEARNAGKMDRETRTVLGFPCAPGYFAPLNTRPCAIPEPESTIDQPELLAA